MKLNNMTAERKAAIDGYAFKWNPKRRAKEPVAWRKGYGEAEFAVVHSENYSEWVRE